MVNFIELRVQTALSQTVRNSAMFLATQDRSFLRFLSLFKWAMGHCNIIGCDFLAIYINIYIYIYIYMTASVF
jgi:hypothetical protein